MILHKYLDNFGIEALKNYELKANVPTKFNDPIDCLPRNIGEWTHAKAKKQIKDKNKQRQSYDDLKS